LCAVTINMGSDDAKQMIDLGVTAMIVGNDQFFMRSGAAAQLALFDKVMKNKSA
jgi:2-keto-3-deoxy-L-rhamnonate aldolase RhmA